MADLLPDAIEVIIQDIGVACTDQATPIVRVRSMASITRMASSEKLDSSMENRG